jgi:hypothetical protein
MTDSNPSTASEKIWICAHVEAMHATDDYMSIDRDAWERMTEAEQNAFIESFASETVSNAGGYGASVVDEFEVPDEYKDES